MISMFWMPRFHRESAWLKRLQLLEMAATAYHGRRGWFCFFVELRSYLNYLGDGQMQQKIANSYDLQVSRLNDS